MHLIVEDIPIGVVGFQDEEGVEIGGGIANVPDPVLSRSRQESGDRVEAFQVGLRNVLVANQGFLSGPAIVAGVSNFIGEDRNGYRDQAYERIE